MNYVKGHLSNYKAQSGSPALMETSVNQTWAIQQSTTGLLTSMTQSSASLPAHPLHDVPQEQLPSSSTQLPVPIFTQSRKLLKALHDSEMQQQQQQQQAPRKRMRIESSVTLDNDNSNIKLQTLDDMQLDRQDTDDLGTSSRLEQLQLTVSRNSTFGSLSSQIPHAPPMVTPIIQIINRKETAKPKDFVENQIQDIIRVFQLAIDGFLYNPDFKISQQNFYDVSSVSTKFISDEIFTLVSQALQDNINKICQTLETFAPQKVNFLSMVVLSWNQFLSVLTKLNEIFNPLNDTYIHKKTKYSSLFHFGKEKYVNMMSTSTKIKTRTINTLTHLISCQRRQIYVGQKDITATLQIIHENLPTYAAEFGQELTHSTRRFYQTCASTGASSTAKNYVTYAFKLILSEPTAIYDYRHYIPNNIESPSKIALKELLSKQRDHLLSCFALAVEEEQEQLLKSLYQLFTHGDISKMQAAFERYIIDACDKIFTGYGMNNKGQNADDPTQYGRFVAALLGLKSQLKSMVDRCFGSDDSFQQILKKSFEASINRDPSSSSQHIASYMNHLLESIPIFSLTAHSSVLESLDQCIDLLRNLHAEDLFKCYYKVYLARRLLMYRNQASLTKEMDMMERLQSECGVDFAKDLFAMINEVRTSQSRMTKYEEVASAFCAANTIYLNVNILSSENWSIPFRKEELELSPEMSAQQKSYNNFYNKENSNKRLTWIPSLSTCILNATYSNTTIELHTSQHQAIVLLLFNDRRHDHWTAKMVSDRTGLGEDKATKLLHSLSTQEVPLLNRWQDKTKVSSNNSVTNKREWKDDYDVFTYNSNFTSTQSTIQLSNILDDLPQNSIKAINKRELFSRREIVQACIMKILKERKSLDSMEIWDLVKARSKNDSPKFLIRLSLVEDELQGLIKRGLIRNPMDDLYEYCEE